jgi:TatD DNase family protein
MLEPIEASQEIREFTLVDTHGHAHLERESESIYWTKDPPSNLISLTCAVEQADWQKCLEYTAQSPSRIPALGIHPWYLSDITDDWLEQLEGLLLQHPGAMVGEIGLCKQAKFLRTYKHGKQAALTLQRDVFTKQITLAAKLHRPVSIHCVNQQGILLEVLKELRSLPPSIALHSFTGTSHHVKQLLEWEKSLHLPNNLLFFGFSHAVNYAMCSSDKSRRKGQDAVREVPRSRLLSESDVHCTDNLLLGTIGSVAYLAWALEETIACVAALTAQNGLFFLGRS